MTPLAASPATTAAPFDSAHATFQGIVRDDGRVATRNYVGVFIGVNCAATVARKIAEHFTEERLAAWPNVDGVVPFTHELGCGMEMTGEPMNLLRRAIAGTLRNPNVGAAVLLSLGCERNNQEVFMQQEHLVAGDRLKNFVMQEMGGTQKTIEAGIAAVEAMLPAVNAVKREAVPARHLTVGLLTTAGDGATALAANPAVGHAVDLLVKGGGTAILSETSEVAAAKDAIVARAATPEVGERFEQRIAWWGTYSAGRDTRLTRRTKAPASADEALAQAWAALARAGSSPLQAVYEYAHPVTARGLVFMDTPAYDAMAATGQIAGGATLLCLTTGRGTGFGALPAPTVKVAATTDLYQRMEDDLDINGGLVLDGEVTVEQMGERIFRQWLAHASGEQTKAEELGVGASEFVPWPIGVFA